MKLNNLSRLTALLLALTMILPTFAVAEEGTDFDQITEDYLNSVAETVVLIDTLVADGYCETCAADVASAGLTAWPVSGYTCLYEHLDDLSASAAYDMLVAYYNANTAEGDSLWKAYITSHNNHVINAANAGSSDYPAIICDCAQPVLKPGDSNHGTSCPWADEEYVTSQTVTDQNGTGITVTGDIPEGVELTVKTAAKPSIETLITMIDPSKYAEEPNVLAYDITLTHADGTPWQPTTAVTVTVPGAYSTVPTDPLAEAVHMTGETTFEVLAATVNAEGSVSFVATGFSDYYIVAGTSNSNLLNTDVTDLPGVESYYYVEPGTTLIFDGSNISQPNPLHSSFSFSLTGWILNRTTITVSLNASLGDNQSFYVSSNGGYYIHIIVADKKTIIEKAIQTQPVYLAIRTDGEIPSEPAVSGGTYYRIYIDSATGEYKSQGSPNEGVTFADTAASIIDSSIVGFLQNSVDGSSTVGISDATGLVSESFIKQGSIDWAQVLKIAVERGAKPSGSNNSLTNDDLISGKYIVIPYVIKYMAEAGYGWHIDCAVVPATRTTLSYQLNLENYNTSATLGLPNAQTKAEPFTATIGNISGLSTINDFANSVSATLKNDDSGKGYTLTFEGWSTDPYASDADPNYAPGKTVNIEADTVLYAVWNTTAQVGTLYLQKIVEGGISSDLKYDFTIVRNGTAQSWNRRLSDGEIQSVEDLIPGIYTITEIPVAHDGYALSEVRATKDGVPHPLQDSGDGKYSYEVEVMANTEATVTFTNVYELDVADLTITKEVVGADAPTGDVFTFTVTLLDANDQILSGSFNVTGDVTGTISNGGTLTLTANQSAKIEGLPIDTKYTVTETAKAGYTANESIQEGRIVAAGATATFTNTYSVADLTITKNVVTEEGVTAPADDEFAITVTLTAAEGAVLADSYTVTGVTAHTYSPAADKKSATLTLHLKGEQTANISGIQTGTQYSVAEADKDYYEETVPAGQQTLNANAEVTVTNKYLTGNLTVAKTVVGTFAPTDADSFTFTLMLKDGDTIVTPPITVNNKEIEWQDSKYPFTLKNGENITIYGIPVGVTYTVTETENPDYTTTVNGNASNTATGTANNDPTVTFTNTYKYSQLTITKKVSTDTPVGIAGQSFNITVILPPKTGDYTYTNTNGTSGKVPSDGKLTIKADEKITIDKVPIGAAYSVTEDDLAYFDEKVEPNSGTIVDADNAVNITNTYKPGKLTISKNVVGTTAPKGQESEEFAFVVTLTDEKGAKVSGTFAYTKGADTASLPFTEGSAEIKLKDNESITFTNLPQGVKYKVEEKADDVSAKYTPTSNGAEGTISGTDSNAAFTNTYKFNDLTISKNVDNKSAALYEAPAVEFPFVLNLKDANGTLLTGTYQVKDSDEKIVLGTTFNLKAGESITIQDLPVGATYTVTENAVEGFVLDSKTGDTGSIEANQEYTATFTNEYHVGQLKISKTVVDNSGMGYDLSGDEFTFTVDFGNEWNPITYTKQSGSTSETCTFTNSITLKDGETATFDRIPAGVTYEVTESEIMPCVGYKLPASANITGEIEAGKTSAATFENTYCTGTLTIIKTGMQGDESAIFTVNARTKDHPKGHNYTIALSNNEQVTIAGLVIGSSFSISENGKWSNRYSVASEVSGTIAEDGTTVTINNAKKNHQWLHDEDSVENDFSTNGNYQ